MELRISQTSLHHFKYQLSIGFPWVEKFKKKRPQEALRELQSRWYNRRTCPNMHTTSGSKVRRTQRWETNDLWKTVWVGFKLETNWRQQRNNGCIRLFEKRTLDLSNTNTPTNLKPPAQTATTHHTQPRKQEKNGQGRRFFLAGKPKLDAANEVADRWPPDLVSRLKAPRKRRGNHHGGELRTKNGHFTKFLHRPNPSRMFWRYLEKCAKNYKIHDAIVI